MNRCATCKHYGPDPHFDRAGDCNSPKFSKSYQATPESIQPDGVAVEADEGWGIIVAAGFGCVHHVPTEAECPQTDA